MKKIRKKRIENGVCIQCGKNEPAMGILRCEQCRIEASARTTITRENRIRNGLCDRCGKNKPESGLLRCSNCAKLFKNRRSKEYKNLSAEGICVTCKKSKATKGVQCLECSAKANAWHKKRYYELKDEAFNRYGGYICNCCGEDEHDFLTIDHIDGNGNKHRKEIKGSIRSFYGWLKKNNYPNGFQVLCMNCNWGRYKNKDGICPHKRKMSSAVK